MLFFALYACIFFSSLNFTSPLMAGSYIASELGGSTDISYYGITFFGLGNAAVFPLGRIIESNIGKRQGLLLFLFFFTLSTYGAAISPTFPVFVIFRFLEGVFSGIFFSFCLNLLNILHEEKSKKKSFAFLGFLVSISPTIGASFGGWISYDYNWRWIFYLQIPFLLLIMCIIHKYKKELQEPKKDLFFDKVGYIFYLLSIGPFTMAVCLGQELDWLRSPLICFLFALSAVCLPFLILWELRQKNPLLDLSLFRIPHFFISIFSIFFLYSTYLGMIVLLASWLHLDVNYTPLWIAVLMLNMLVAALLLSVFLFKWIEKTHPFLPVIFAVICFAISALYSSYFNAEINFERIAISRIFSGFGLAFFFVPLLKIALDSVPEIKKGMANGAFQTFRVLGGGLGVSFYSTVWLRRKVFYHERLGSSFTDYSELTENLFSHLSLYQEKGLPAKELLEKALMKQSTALALGDTFYLMSWVMLALLLIILCFSLKSLLSYYKKRSWVGR